MSNSTRNTLVLAAILILVCAVFALRLGGLYKQTSENMEFIKDAKVSVDSLQILLSSRESLLEEYEFQKAMMGQQSKLILGEDSPSITYGYLLGLLGWMGANVNFDFAVADSQKVEGNINEYIISGSSPFYNLLRLASNIEKQQLVMTIEDFSIASSSIAKADTVDFSMILRTYYMPGGPYVTEMARKSCSPPDPLYQLFMPRLSDDILPWDPPSDLLNVEEARLIGISRGMAFFRDSQGIIRILSRGSRVAYGYLYRIDQAEGRVLFRLNKYGLEDEYIMLMQNDL